MVSVSIYRGLERNIFDLVPNGEKTFWHESKDEYTPLWKVRTVEDGNIQHHSSDFHKPINLGKFKHILTTENIDFEYRVFEKGILRITKGVVTK